MHKIIKTNIIFLLLLPFFIKIAFADEDTIAKRATLTIAATSNIESHLMNYDYYKDTITTKYGLNRLAFLINSIRNNNHNFILIDNGNFFGNSLTSYYSLNTENLINNPPILEALEFLQYDAVVLGNKDIINYLDKKDDLTINSNIEFISSNLYKGNSSNLLYKPYVIIDKRMKVKNSEEEIELKVGIIGATSPQLALKDYSKISTSDIVEQVNKYVQILKEKEKVDIIIVALNSNLPPANNTAYLKNSNNAVLQVSKIKGIDLIIAGMGNQIFPYTENDNEQRVSNSFFVNNEQSKVNGVPLLMPGSSAQYLGVYNLNIEHKDNKWKLSTIVSSDLSLESTEQTSVAFNNEFKELHDNIKEYVNKPLAKATSDINNYFYFLSKSEIIALINNASKDFVKTLKFNDILNDYVSLPIVSFNSTDTDLDIRTGNDFAIKDLSKIEEGEEELIILKAKGLVIKEYLEWSAQAFNNISQNKNNGAQYLLNKNFTSKDYGISTDFTYDIDLSYDNKYKGNAVINSENKRIYNLKYENKIVENDDEFLIVINRDLYRQSPILRINTTLVFETGTIINEVIYDYFAKNNNTIAHQNQKSFNVIMPEGINAKFTASKDSTNFAKFFDTIVFLKDNKDGSVTYDFINIKDKKNIF